MDRMTNLRSMPAPGVGSGQDAKDGMLAPKGLAQQTSSERGSNTIEQNVTSAPPVSGAGGRAKFK